MLVKKGPQGTRYQVLIVSGIFDLNSIFIITKVHAVFSNTVCVIKALYTTLWCHDKRDQFSHDDTIK